MAGEIVDGFAQRIRGFTEIEIEHPIRVGDHGGGPFGNKILTHQLVTGAGG
jgi:hypothetical protein